MGVGLGGAAGAAASLKDSTAMVLVTDSETTVQISEMISEDIVSPTKKHHPRTCIELKRRPSLSSKEGTSTDTPGGMYSFFFFVVNKFLKKDNWNVCKS